VAVEDEDYRSARSAMSVARRLAFYSLWQTLFGVLFGLGSIAALAVLVLAASFLVR
jgi:hypothetical protein